MTYYRGIDGTEQRLPERDLNPPELREFTQAELDAAREDLIDNFVTQGRELGDWSLADFLDLEIDDDSRKFAETLATMNGGLFREGGACFQMALDAWYREIVARHLPEDMISERAEEIDAEGDQKDYRDGE